MRNPSEVLLMGSTDGTPLYDHDGRFLPVAISPDGHIEVEIHGENLTGFGEINTAHNEPMFQHDWAYNYINPEVSTATTNGNGTVTATNQMLTVSTGANANSLAVWRPKRMLRYRPGQSSLIRFTLLLDSAATGNSQLAGFSSGESGLLVGSVETSRGVGRTYGGVREIQTATVTVKSSNVQNATVTLGGTAFTVPVTNGADTAATAAELAAFDYTTSYPGWTASQLGSTVRFVCLIAGDQSGVFSITFPTSGTASISETVAGVASSFDFTPQASFNVDPLDGTGPSRMTIDWTKLNVWQIQWTYLGAGPITFKLCNPNNEGEFFDVHRIIPANTATTPSLTQPGGFFSVSVRNTTCTTAKTAKMASCAGFIQGEVKHLGPRRAKSHTLNVGTSFTPIVSIKNTGVYRSRINMGEVTLLGMVISNNSSTRSVEVQLLEQAILNNTVAWASENVNNSIVDASTTATSYTNGTPEFACVVGPNGTHEFDFHPHYITLEPNNWVTVVAKALSGTADVSVALDWVEDH